MIVSTANSRVKEIVRLREKSRERVRENVFLAEGIKMLEEAPAEKIKEIYLEETLLQEIAEKEDTDFRKLEQKLADCRQAGIRTEAVTREVFRKMSDTQSPQGVLCVMERFSHNAGEILEKALQRREEKGRAPLFLLLEDIQDPGNLGTMLRTAEGAGADGVFMTGNTVDIYHPKTIRSTMGSLYRVPFVQLEGGLDDTIRLLREKGIRVYAAHLKGEKYYYEQDYSGGSAFLIGNEGKGLKEQTAELADCLVKIPMEGKLESLNAAVAAALLMYRSRY